MNIEDAVREVRAGSGFALLRIATAQDDLPAFTARVLEVGAHFGTLLSQNAAGELVGHVVDATREERTPRLYRSNFELRPHTDHAAVLVLACWQPAKTGGETLLVSAQAVFEQLREQRPDLVPLLERGFHCHRRGEEGPQEDPVTPYRVPVFWTRHGEVSCCYQRALITAGHQALGLALTQDEVAALDLVDAIAARNAASMTLQRGDVLIVNNYALLHARTGFTDDPERRRHLLRLWLEAPGLRRVPAQFRLFPAANGVPPQAGRACTYDFAKLLRRP